MSRRGGEGRGDNEQEGRRGGQSAGGLGRGGGEMSRRGGEGRGS